MNKVNLKRLAGLAAVVLIGYFTMVEVNTYLGKKTLEKTGLEILPLEAAFLKAKEQDKPILADLSAIWCPTCRRLDAQVLSDPAVKERIHDQFIYARIEYESEEGKAFQKRYGVSGFPNLLILNADGSIVRKLAMTFEPEDFLKQLHI